MLDNYQLPAIPKRLCCLQGDVSDYNKSGSKERRTLIINYIVVVASVTVNGVLSGSVMASLREKFFITR